MQDGQCEVSIAGSILEILTAPLEGDRTVEVFYNGTAMIMFVRNITERAKKL